MSNYSFARLAELGIETNWVDDCPRGPYLQRSSEIIRGLSACIPYRVMTPQQFASRYRNARQQGEAILAVRQGRPTNPLAVRQLSKTLDPILAATCEAIWLDLANCSIILEFAPPQAPAVDPKLTLGGANLWLPMFPATLVIVPDSGVVAYAFAAEDLNLPPGVMIRYDSRLACR